VRPGVTVSATEVAMDRGSPGTLAQLEAADGRIAAAPSAF
jgi:hypothetical protein